MSDGVIHTGFVHTTFRNSRKTSRSTSKPSALSAARSLESDRPLIVTSGLAFLTPGRPAKPRKTRQFPFPPHNLRACQATAASLAECGVRAPVVRLPQVDGDGGHAFVPRLLSIAWERGVSAHVGDGLNRWPARRRLEAAHLYRLVLENRAAGGRYHTVADEGVPLKEIAAVIVGTQCPRWSAEAPKKGRSILVGSLSSPAWIWLREATGREYCSAGGQNSAGSSLISTAQSYFAEASRSAAPR